VCKVHVIPQCASSTSTDLNLRVSFPLIHDVTRVTIFIHTSGIWDEGFPAYPISVNVIMNGRFYFLTFSDNVLIVLRPIEHAE